MVRTLDYEDLVRTLDSSVSISETTPFQITRFDSAPLLVNVTLPSDSPVY